MTPELDTLDSEPRTALQVDVEELPRWRRRVTVVVPPERVSRDRRRLTQSVARRLRVPGFRPGRAPAHLVRQRLGTEVEEELLHELLREGFREAMETRGLEPVSAPVVQSAEFTADGALRAVAELDVRPEVRLARLGGFRVERPEAAVPPDATERVLERLRDERAEARPVERPATRGDVVIVDVSPLDGEGEPVSGYEIRLGSGEGGAEIEAQLEGVSPGETREVEQGSRRWRVTAREVRERTLPPLDDEFAQSVSNAGGLAELRERVAENLRLEGEARARAEQRERLVDAVAEANGVEVPESLVERYVERMLAPREAAPGGARRAAGRAQAAPAHEHGHAAGHRHAPGAPPVRAHGVGPRHGHGAGEPHDHSHDEAHAPGDAAVERPGPGDADPELMRILREAAERSLRRMLVVETVAREQGLEPSDEDLDRYLSERVEGEVGAARRSLERSGRLEELRGHLRGENVYRFLEAQSGLRPDEGSPAELTPRKE